MNYTTALELVKLFLLSKWRNRSQRVIFQTITQLWRLKHLYRVQTGKFTLGFSEFYPGIFDTRGKINVKYLWRGLEVPREFSIELIRFKCWNKWHPMFSKGIYDTLTGWPQILEKRRVQSRSRSKSSYEWNGLWVLQHQLAQILNKSSYSFPASCKYLDLWTCSE